MTNSYSIRHNVVLVSLLASVLALAGCKSGESTESLPNTDTDVNATATYNGPAPDSDEVQKFKREVWDKLAGNDKCGACHNSTGNDPKFVHEANINTAFAAATTIVQLANPSQSRIVAKVGEGHNCWLGSSAGEITACTDLLTGYIEAWAGDDGGSAKTVELSSPTIKDVGASLQFPESSSDFVSTVYPLLDTYCSECHSDGGQTPYIASVDYDVAYSESRSRIDLNDPNLSRLVTRLSGDRHNCWNNDCTSSADEMETKIQDFIALLGDPVEPDADMVISKALNLINDGISANTGGRFEDNVIALYEFKSGEGQRAFDTSGVDPALDLTLSGNFEWVGGYGVGFGPAIPAENLNSGKAQGSTSDSRKLHQRITLSGEYSIEAWVIPGDITQEEARIVTYSGSSMERNLTLGQDMQSYQAFHRTTTSDEMTPLITADDDPYLLQATLQHVVVNYTPSGGRKIYVNGQFSGDMDGDESGTFAEWDNTYALVMGNETDGDSPWNGTLRMVAVHDRALTEEQIQANYDVGVGQKFYLLFSVAHLIDVPQSFIAFEASQFDSSSYLFAAPFFISLDDEVEPSNIPLEGMRIGVNGQEVLVGQTFANLDITLNADDYDPGVGQPLSRMAAVIPSGDEGPETDELFLTFERLGGNENVRVEGPAPGPLDVAFPDSPISVIGLKTFDEINASMSRMTGVATTADGVFGTYLTVKQQLPTVEDINGFLASHQMAITQMAIQYCDALVDNRGDIARTTYFDGFNFDANSNSAFDATGQDQIAGSLIERMIGTAMDDQPDPGTIETELTSLMGTLAVCDDSSEDCVERTKTVVKASCAAVLGSGVTLIQ